MIKSFLYSAISWSIGQGILALICFVAYDWFLFDLFKIEITFIQWAAIVIIAACLMPGKLFTTKANTNEDPSSKINEFVTSLTKKKS